MNSDKNHLQNKVTDFFKYLRIRHPLLYLLKDNTSRSELDISNQQKESAVIKIPRQQGQNEVRPLDNSSIERERKEAERSATQRFEDHFKGLKLLEEQRVDAKRKPNNFLKYPQSYCITFVINVVAFFAFSFSIFSQRYKTQYFLSNLVQQQFSSPAFYDTTLGFQSFNGIRNFADFKKYMTVTLPQTSIQDSAKRQEWLKHGWVVLGGGDFRVIHC